MKAMLAWWPVAPAPGNLGDVLTPAIMKMLGVPVRWVRRDQAALLGVGSILRFARPGVTVFGSGAMRASDKPSKGARFLAVRGPLSARIVESVGARRPTVLGDPALLLPHFLRDDIQKRHDVGIVPHYVDHEQAARAHPTERIINVLRADPLEVVREIRECRAIVSSSLHGLIVAHAFGIRAAWVRFSDRLCGDDIKFRDYAMSVGVELEPHRSLGDARPVLGSYDSSALLEAAKAIRR